MRIAAGKPGKCLGVTLSELTGAAALLFVQYFGRCERRPLTVQVPDCQPFPSQSGFSGVIKMDFQTDDGH